MLKMWGASCEVRERHNRQDLPDLIQDIFSWNRRPTTTRRYWTCLYHRRVVPWGILFLLETGANAFCMWSWGTQHDLVAHVCGPRGIVAVVMQSRGNGSMPSLPLTHCPVLHSRPHCLTTTKNETKNKHVHTTQIANHKSIDIFFFFFFFVIRIERSPS